MAANSVRLAAFANAEDIAMANGNQRARAAKADDRRQDTRWKTLKGGRIAFDQNPSPVDCIVRDLSVHGARLQVDSAAGIPTEFNLAMGDQWPTYRCFVRWRTSNALGVVLNES